MHTRTISNPDNGVHAIGDHWATEGSDMNLKMSLTCRALVSCSSLAIIAALALSAPAHAADTADDVGAPSIYIDPENPDFGTKVDALVVTATPLAAAAPLNASVEATEPQSIITRSTIDQFIPTTSDYTQIVNLAPSMSGSSSNGPGLGEAKSTLRGFQDGEYNITYDGIPWGDANGPTHHSTSFFPSSTIGAVVVDRGPGNAGDLGQASFGGSVNLFSPEVSDEAGGSQSFTAGSWNTRMSVTKLNTGDIAGIRGAHVMFNFQELTTDGALTYQAARANNVLVRGVFPINTDWSLTVLGTWNYTHINTPDKGGATLTQVAAFGKDFALSNDPANPTYYKYNLVIKHTYFNYARLFGHLTPNTTLENTVYSYYYKNDTESALDVTLSPADILAKTGLKVTPVSGGPSITNGHIPGYTKLNVYQIYGDVLRLEQKVSFGTLRGGVWWERSNTGPRARYDYDASANRAPDYRQAALTGVSSDLEYLQFSSWNQYQPFVDFQWQVTPELTITPGVKYVDFDLRVDADVNQKSRLPFHGGRNFSKTLYYLTGNYKVDTNWSVYAQYATGFLVPDISITQFKNPNLDDVEPQESVNYQLGTVYHGQRFSFDADIYHIDFKNKQQNRVNTTTGETEIFNLGGATYQGVEGQVSYMFRDHLFGFANGSVNRAETQGLTTLGIASGKQIANAPTATAAYGLLYRNNDWSISLSDKRTGRQWAVEGEVAAYEIPAYDQTDLSVVRKFGRYRIEGAVYNLFDTQPVTSITPGKTVPYDQYRFQTARNFQVSLKANF